MDERYCTECRAVIPPRENVCPACGVYAGDVFDGKLPRRRKRSWAWIVVVLLLAGAAAAAFFLRPHPEPRRRAVVAKPHVVKDQRDALQTLRHFLATPERAEECVALMARPKAGSAYVIAAVDRCKHASLGEFIVDAKTAKVTKK